MLTEFIVQEWLWTYKQMDKPNNIAGWQSIQAAFLTYIHEAKLLNHKIHGASQIGRIIFFGCFGVNQIIQKYYSISDKTFIALLDGVSNKSKPFWISPNENLCVIKGKRSICSLVTNSIAFSKSQA